MIKSFSIKNFRGIEELKELQSGQLNIFIGDNGTSKTSILDAIHYSFSPNFLSGKIKHTDFPSGNDNPIHVSILFNKSIQVNLPDGYTEQPVNCNSLSLTIKKREKKTAGKVFSDLVTIEHIVLPDFDRNPKGWTISRKTGTSFSFTERSLGMSQISTTELPRSFLFGKERDRQIQKGFNSSFSTIIDDLNWRFSRSLRKDLEETGTRSELLTKIPELSNQITDQVEIDDNEVFKELKKRTESFGIDEIKLSVLDSIAPFESSFLSTTKDILNLPIKLMGSGIEMIISLLLLETLASMSKEKLIILIDEPELHLHPNLQEQLSDYLLKISSGNGHQIFLTTHSPIFFKNCIGKTGVKTFITNKDKSTSKLTVTEAQFNNGLFPWSPSWGEINYFAYGYMTIEFHDELYGFIQEKTGKYHEDEFDSYMVTQGIATDKHWIREKDGKPISTNKRTLPVFIRNKVHHPENAAMKSANFTPEELKKSIDSLVSIAKQLK